MTGVSADALRAQTLPVGFWFTRQGQIDSVSYYYPSFTGLAGSLVIGYPQQFSTDTTDIRDLTPLSSLQQVGGLIIRNNPRLKTLAGLHHIQTIGGEYVIRIVENDSLIDLSGLSALKSTGLNLIEIIDNKQLVSLTGLERLKEVEDLTIEQNPQLDNLNGLDSLRRVRDGLSINRNALVSTNLPALKRVSKLGISRENYLYSLQGLDSLTTIDRNLLIYENPLLNDISALHNVRVGNINSWIGIDDNASLVSLAPLRHAPDTVLSQLLISRNAKLSDTLWFDSVKTIRILEISGNSAIKSVFLPALERAGYTLDNNNLSSSSFLISLNDSLQNLDGLYNLRHVVGNLMLFRNWRLRSLAGLSSLEHVGRDFHIDDADSLPSLAGLENLKWVGLTFQIRGNDSLKSLCQFNQLQYLNSELIIAENNLHNLDGLENLHTVGNFVGIGEDSSLTNINALENLDTIGTNTLLYDADLAVGFAPKLQSIDALASVRLYEPAHNRSIYINELTRLKNIRFFNVTTLRRLQIGTNDSLTSINFPALTSVGENSDYNPGIYIRNNPLLPALDSFSNITYLADSLVLRGNASLWNCESICHLLENGIPPGRFGLGGNAYPCNSVADVEAVICDTLLSVTAPEPAAAPMAVVTAWPNPASSRLYVRTSEALSGPITLVIFDALGHRALEARLTAHHDAIDVAHLPAGVYWLQLAGLGAGTRVLVQR